MRRDGKAGAEGEGPELEGGAIDLKGGAIDLKGGGIEPEGGGLGYRETEAETGAKSHIT